MTSDREGFWARWSRRKREAKTTTPASPQSAEQATVPEASDHLPTTALPDVSDIVAQLPPIDEITATTDIRAFLAPGVPTELRLAALRRAWSADPAIRDFIGLAENQWDFNVPEGIPGFGSLLDPEQVRQLLAKVVGGDAPELAKSAPEPTEPNLPRTEVATVPEALSAASAPDPANEPPPQGIDEPGSVSRSVSDEPTAQPRRHGSALPQ
jgi:hypothetical protein